MSARLSLPQGLDMFPLVWVDQIDRIRPRDFEPVLPLEEKDEFQYVLGDTTHWQKEFLAPAADPKRSKNNARISKHAAGEVPVDLVRYEYSFRGRDVTIYHNASAMIVRVRPRVEPKDSRGWVRAINEAAHELLKMSGRHRPVSYTTYVRYSWTFKFPAQIGEGTLISTNPRQLVQAIRHASDRADALVHRGSIWLMTYKRHPPRSGLGNTSGWFANPRSESARQRARRLLGY